jgi:hypothetical protein
MTAILEPPAAPEAPTRPVAFLSPAAPTEPLRVAAPATRQPAPAPAAAPAPPPRPRRTVERRLAYRGVGVLMLVAFIAAIELTPAPDGPEPVVTAVDLLIGNAILLTLAAVVCGMWAARRWSPWVGAGFGGLLAVDVALCPATGHHVIGGWWYAQAALSAVVLLAPVALLVARRAGRLR